MCDLLSGYPVDFLKLKNVSGLSCHLREKANKNNCSDDSEVYLSNTLGSEI